MTRAPFRAFATLVGLLTALTTSSLAVVHGLEHRAERARALAEGAPDHTSGPSIEAPGQADHGHPAIGSSLPYRWAALLPAVLAAAVRPSDAVNSSIVLAPVAPRDRAPPRHAAQPPSRPRGPPITA